MTKLQKPRAAALVGAFLRRAVMLTVLFFFVFSLFAGPAAGEEPLQPTATIYADGGRHFVFTSPETVAQALGCAGLVLGPLDRVTPALDAALPENGKIHVTRVEKTVVHEIATEAHETTFLADADLRPGMVIKVREGRDGIIHREIHIWKKDGEITSEKVVAETEIQERTDGLEIRSTSSLPSRGRKIARCLEMEATAYDPGPRSCGKFADGFTSIGLKAGRGVVAVDPRVVPMRSRLYIEGYGFAIAGDVGSAIKGNRIDLGFDTYRQAIEYGRRKVKVYILE